MITLEDWRERMADDMRLRDLRQRTVDGYLLAVRLFLDRAGKEPETIGEEDIRAYLLNLRDDRRQAPSSINIALVHMLVPGGALTDDGKWITTPRRNKRMLVPTQKLARLFWGRFRGPARRAVPNVAFPNLTRKKRWMVDCREAVQGNDGVLEYLGRHVHRTAISNRAVTSCTDRSVTLQYRSHPDDKPKWMTLSPDEFLRRFPQHVLPRGFHRVRSFGLLHPKHRTTLRQIHLMLGRSHRLALAPRSGRRSTLRRCPVCHAIALSRGLPISQIDLDI